INTMSNYNRKLIELPKYGKAIVVTDLHGNLNDYKRYMGIWEKCRDDNTHFILTGDFIHAMGREDDRSIEILESVKQNWENYEDFHPLLGNHEWSTISRVSVFKGGINQSLTFDELLKEHFRENWKMKLEEYQDFFKKLPIAVKTDNKVFISHGGPPRNIKNLDEIIHITDKGFIKNDKLSQILWNRDEDFTKEELVSFLRAVGCNAMIVGHTPVNGVKLIDDKQIILSSSYTQGKKEYVLLDLEKKIKDARDILKMVKQLHWYS
ncbi:MAG: metallophosphoesterase, partial [Methanobacterium sp.]